MSEKGMFEVHAIRITETEEREKDEFIARDETHANNMARTLSRVDKYAWTEVVYCGEKELQRIRVYVKGHCAMIG